MYDGRVFPSLQVSVAPHDPETSCSVHLNFEWELVDYNRDELTLQLEFDTPPCVSGASNEGDWLVITFYDQRFFVGTSEKMILPGTVIKKRIKRQMALSGTERDTLDALADSAFAMLAIVSALSIVFGIFIEGARRRCLTVFKSLLVILHVLLIQVNLATHVELFLLSLHRILYFEFLPSEWFTEDIVSAYESDPIDIHFEALGYETSNFIVNLGTVTILGISVLAITALVYLFSRFNCW